MKRANRATLAYTAICIMLGTPAPALASRDTILGSWRLNHQLSTDAQDSRSGPDLSGNHVSTTVTVGGIPLPKRGSVRQSELSKIPSKDPDILRCAKLSIEPLAEHMSLTCQGVGSETLSKGNVQGTRTTWSKRKLSTRYATTSRKVIRTFKLRPDGRLLVTVKLNPNRAKAAVHKRIFDPVD